MAADGNLALSDASRRPPRTASGEWDGEAMLAAVLGMSELGVASAQVADVALVLRELTVSQKAMQRFNQEMGWPADAQHSFSGLNSRLVENAEAWLSQIHGLAWPNADNTDAVADARLSAAFEAASNGASIAAVETALPEESPACRARTAYIRGEAALRNRMRKRAVQDFKWFAAIAPHVTAGHRRLGQIALAKRDVRRAARYFEAAVAIPNQRWTNADVPDIAPLLVGRVGRRLEIYRFRGGLYPINITPDFMGLAVVAGRLIQVYDTPVYRLWRRVRPRPEVIERLRSPGLRRKFKHLARRFLSLLTGVLLRAGQRYPRIAPVLSRVAAWLSGGGEKKEAAADAPGRLMSILLRLCRPFRRTWLGRAYRRIEARFPARRLKSLKRVLGIRMRMFMLRAVFRARELPPGSRVDTVDSLIERVGVMSARA